MDGPLKEFESRNEGPLKMGDWMLSQTRASLFGPNQYPEKKHGGEML